MRNLLLTMFLLLSSYSTYACYDQRLSSKANFDNCLVNAQQGSSIAQTFLGAMYYGGNGVTQDYKQALKWHRKAAAQGVPRAQYNLALMYYGGKGVTQDYKQALKWSRKAAEQGKANAQYNLALMYASGKGVTQDSKQAVKW